MAEKTPVYNAPCNCSFPSKHKLSDHGTTEEWDQQHYWVDKPTKTVGHDRWPYVKQAEEDTVPCKWCSVPTTMTGTKECDPCNELRHRIQSNPELAKAMLEELS